jgi:biofilm PGA synthesis N-glycosyltransferase PgaC
MRYVLITPAKNEAANIEKTLAAVTTQTVLPAQWIIVSDGSTDRTDDIVKAACTKHAFIKFNRNDSPPCKDFSSKVNAFNLGRDSLTVGDYDFIGNLDADVSFESDYFRNILSQFSSNPKLGLAGGLVHEYVDGVVKPFKMSLNSVSGAIQLFRRTCFEEIGGYLPNKSGGIDSAAEICARARGWEARTFPEYKVMHHGHMLTGASSIHKMMFQSGITKYKLGYHPLFHAMSSLRRATSRPVFTGALCFFAGYVSAAFRKEKKILPRQVIEFLRKEQLQRLGLKSISR